jgi:hypothetical protein
MSELRGLRGTLVDGDRPGCHPCGLLACTGWSRPRRSVHRCRKEAWYSSWHRTVPQHFPEFAARKQPPRKQPPTSAPRRYGSVGVLCPDEAPNFCQLKRLRATRPGQLGFVCLPRPDPCRGAVTALSDDCRKVRCGWRCKRLVCVGGVLLTHHVKESLVYYRRRVGTSAACSCGQVDGASSISRFLARLRR